MTKAQRKLMVLRVFINVIDKEIDDLDGKAKRESLESMAKRLIELSSEAAEEVYRISERYID